MAPRSRSLIEVRKPPVDVVFALHLPKASGKCRWCGLPVDEKTMFGAKRLLWHAACELEFKIITMPEVARAELFKRDKGICVDCKEDWGDRVRFRKGSASIHASDGEFDASGWATEETREFRRLGFYRSTEVIWISLWEADHNIPLWKIAHLPPLKRLEYFKLDALVTRCAPCHGRKTAKEAADRAHFDEMAGEGPKPKAKRPWGKRKMNEPRRDNTKRLEEL